LMSRRTDRGLGRMGVDRWCRRGRLKWRQRLLGRRWRCWIGGSGLCSRRIRRGSRLIRSQRSGLPRGITDYNCGDPIDHWLRLLCDESRRLGGFRFGGDARSRLGRCYLLTARIGHTRWFDSRLFPGFFPALRHRAHYDRAGRFMATPRLFSHRPITVAPLVLPVKRQCSLQRLHSRRENYVACRVIEVSPAKGKPKGGVPGGLVQISGNRLVHAAAAARSRRCFHSSIDLSTSVTTARSVKMDATANAA
jgi:hypothetical protein